MKQRCVWVSCHCVWHSIFLSSISPSPHLVFKTTQKDPEGTRGSSIYSLSAIWKEEVVLGSPLNVGCVGGWVILTWAIPLWLQLLWLADPLQDLRICSDMPHPRGHFTWETKTHSGHGIYKISCTINLDPEDRQWRRNIPQSWPSEASSVPKS